MPYCHCEAIEYHFDQAFVEAKLNHYKQKGPPIATRILVEALKAQELRAVSLLDIGGGIGTIMHELFPEGITSAILVETASAYLTLAEAEARQRGYHEHVQYVYGDFVEIEDKIPKVDLVTLDRVVCCYPDMERLIETSAAKSGTWYALSYPRDRWYVRVEHAYSNWRRRRRGDPFKTYVHRERRMEELLAKAGFQRCFHRATRMWQVSLYYRTEAKEAKAYG